MRNTTKIIIVSLVIAMILLGIGYAAIQNITLNITGTAVADPSQANFKVKFIGTPDVSNDALATATITNDTNATINVTGLTKKGDSASVTYTIENDSTDLSAELSFATSNSDAEFFEVTTILGKDSLLSGETTTVIVDVELIKEPLVESVTTTIGVEIEAIPIQPGSEDLTGQIIEFSIKTQGTLTAERGMTWGEWIESSYNIYNYTIVNNDQNIYIGGGCMLATPSGDRYVYTSDIISEGSEYEIFI